MKAKFLSDARYCAPKPHLMMARCTVSTMHIHVEAIISEAACAHLQDHVVSTKAIMPGAAMIEAAAAAYNTMLSTGPLSYDGHEKQNILSSASIMLPFVLPLPSLGAHVRLHLEIDTKSGQIAEFSQLSNSNNILKHFLCSSSQCRTEINLRGLSMGRKAIITRMSLLDLKSTSVALASLHQDLLSCKQSDTYLLHPALLDNNTQASAALFQVSAQNRPPPTRVPVGMQACRLGQGPWHTQAWASASFTALLRDESAICNYKLASPSKGDLNTEILEMRFKPASHINKTRVAPQALEPTKIPRQSLYKIRWEAVQPEVCHSKYQTLLEGTSKWQSLDAHTIVRKQGLSRQPTPYSAVASGLCIVQEKLPVQVRLINAIHVSPLDCHVPMPQRQTLLRDAALVGLLRVASSERSATNWQYISRSPYNSHDISQDLALPQADAIGICIEGGIWHSPLLRTAYLNKINTKPYHGDASNLGNSNATIVIGGLGGIGSLVSNSVITRGSKTPLILLSRFGRHNGSNPGHTTYCGNLMCIARCDSTCLEEVAALQCIPAFRQNPLQSILHAGGVIEDRSIQDQVWNDSQFMTEKLHCAQSLIQTRAC